MALVGAQFIALFVIAILRRGGRDESRPLYLGLRIYGGCEMVIRTGMALFAPQGIEA